MSRDYLAEVSDGGSKLPYRNVVIGVDGVGKTSLGASAPSPIFLLARGETGLETLIESGQLGKTKHLPVAESWEDVLGATRALLDGAHKYKTIVVDTANGVERLTHEHVCRRDFGNVWSGEDGFLAYNRGADVALTDWREFLGLLDQLRAAKQMQIVLLVHSRVRNFRNPEGADFDRYTADLNEKTWSLTSRWCDLVLFANSQVTTTTAGKGRREGVGGQERVLFTERTAAWDAKNRLGLPPKISMGSSGAEAWANLTKAIASARREGS